MGQFGRKISVVGVHEYILHLTSNIRMFYFKVPSYRLKHYLCPMIRNNAAFGFVLGVIVPLLGILLLFVIKYMPQNVSLAEFIYLLKTNKPNISKVISLGLIACIPLITYYKNRKLYLTLRGIFIAIILYALLAVAYKFHLL